MKNPPPHLLKRLRLEAEAARERGDCADDILDAVIMLGRVADVFEGMIAKLARENFKMEADLEAAIKDRAWADALALSSQLDATQEAEREWRGYRRTLGLEELK